MQSQSSRPDSVKGAAQAQSEATPLPVASLEIINKLAAAVMWGEDPNTGARTIVLQYTLPPLVPGGAAYLEQLIPWLAQELGPAIPRGDVAVSRRATGVGLNLLETERDVRAKPELERGASPEHEPEQRAEHSAELRGGMAGPRLAAGVADSPSSAEKAGGSSNEGVPDNEGDRADQQRPRSAVQLRAVVDERLEHSDSREGLPAGRTATPPGQDENALILPESAAEHIRNALQILNSEQLREYFAFADFLSPPLEDMAAVRERLSKALEQLEEPAARRLFGISTSDPT